MVRLAQITGDGSSLWPKGKPVSECPNDLVQAISHASYILTTSENFMDEDEHPPTWKWAFQDEMKLHFERLKRKREEKFGGNKGSNDDWDTDGWHQNELAEGLR